MRSRPRSSVAVVLLCVSVLSGCAPDGDVPSEENSVTLEEAKADAQAMEMEIASLIPGDLVVGVEQKPDGTLFSCDEKQHRWKGSTRIMLTPDADPESIVMDLEVRMSDDDRFASRNWFDPTGAYNVQLMSPESAANFIFGEDDPHTIRIASGSVCFTLPEGVYPGGTF